MNSDLSVINPTAFWALLALLIPILIHLFNKSRGKLVRIGHIDLLRPARKIHVTEVKFAKWILLLLRLAIITLAALLLAGLFKPIINNDQGPAVYVTAAWLESAHDNDIKDILSVIEAQPKSRVFLLKEGFPQLDRAGLNKLATGPHQAVAEIGNIWPLLTERLSTEAHNGPVKVYASDYVQQFGFYQSGLPVEIEWHLSAPTADAATPNFPRTAVVAHDVNRTSDAMLLGTALEAIRKHRLPGLQWEMLASDQLNESQLNADWVILLGNLSLSEEQLNLIQTQTVVLTDASDGTTSTTQAYVQLPFYPFSKFELNRFREDEPAISSKTQTNNWQVLLTSSEGQTVLSQAGFGPVRMLHFNSRFNLEWSSITRQAEFPELFLELMLGIDSNLSRFANARINPALLQTEASSFAVEIPIPGRSLQHLLALLLVLCWVTERWLSEKRLVQYAG